jgi:hypothetical protein
MLYLAVLLLTFPFSSEGGLATSLLFNYLFLIEFKSRANFFSKVLLLIAESFRYAGCCLGDSTAY